MLIYLHFPGRIWCISSATLGLHAWRKYPRPMDTLAVHAATKEELSRIGLGAVEVHPMKGRCLRRPFGEDYATITPSGVQTCWVSQLDFFEFTATTPPFDLIARTLLDIVREQWRSWQSHGDTARGYLEPHRIVAAHQHHLDEVEAWIDHGCPVEGQVFDSPDRTEDVAVDPGVADQLGRWIDAGCPSELCPMPLRTPERREAVPLPLLSKKKREEANKGKFDLESLRNGRWAKGLREIAINGLPCDKSLHLVCYELAKWLYWIELYKQPDCEKTIQALLSNFVRNKHNGHCQRINDEDWPSVEQDLRNAIRSAKKLDESHRSESLELFARVRQKRDLGQYKHVIKLAPILAGEIPIHSSSLSSPVLLIRVSTLETPLSAELQKLIQANAGRNRVITFATRLVNLLYEKGGSCRLHQDKLMELLGYKNKNRATKYRDILIDARILKKGNYYCQGKASRLYTLSKEVMGLLDSIRVRNEIVA